MGFGLMGRAVPYGGINGVDTSGLSNREESTTGFVCKEVHLALFFTVYVQN